MASATPATHSRRGLFITIGALVAVVILAGLAAVFVVPRYLCGLTASNRHGLACDIPLQSTATFVSEQDAPDTGTGIKGHLWVYTIPNTTLQAVHDFYAQQVPANGWQCFKISDASAFGQTLPPVIGSGLNGNRGLGLTLQGAGADVQLTILVSTFPTATDASTC